MQFIQAYGNPLALLGHLLYSIVRPVNGADMWTKTIGDFPIFHLLLTKPGFSYFYFHQATPYLQHTPLI